MININKGTLKIKFSKGFGNNLFQYCFGRLLSEYHKLNYSHLAIPELNIKKEEYLYNKEMRTIRFKARNNFEAKKYDKNHIKWFSPRYRNCNFDFFSFIFYFEDYNIYKDYLKKIKSWFPPVKKTNVKDLVLHFRLENRLIWKTHYRNTVKPGTYKKIILSNFNFEKLYIVTDAEKWDYLKKKDILKLHKKILNKYKRNSTEIISIKLSRQYMNDIIDEFKEFKPIIHHSKRFIDDFNFIRSFDKIMFKNSTFAWWASVLSYASKVGVFRPWKPNKGKKNRNLGQTDFSGWFGWGKINDLRSELF